MEEHRGSRLQWSVMAVVAFVVLYLVAVVWEWGQEVDTRLFVSVQVLVADPVASWWSTLARQVLPPVLVVGAVLASLRAAARDPAGWRRVIAVAVMTAVPVVVGRLLRNVVLVRPVHRAELEYLPNSYPSTHMTIVAALALAIWLLVAVRSRWLTWLLVLLVCVAAVGNVVDHTHRPSDVLGSILLVLTVWGCSGVRARARHGPAPS